MSRIEILLTRVEAHLRSLIEGGVTKDSFPRQLHRQLAQALIRSMLAHAHQVLPTSNPSSSMTAPDQYTLVLPAQEALVLVNHPVELDRLAHQLESRAAQSGIIFTDTPILRVVADPQAVEISVLAEFYQPGLDDSSTYQLAENGLPATLSPVDKLPNAFLIVNGLSTYSITTPLVNIGRDPSNHLRLDDPQVSRLHAQLRFIQGRFVIFDLDSRGGTYVNGVLVTSHALNPGDVIQLAGVPMVYGQELASPAGQTQQLPAEPPPPEVL